MVLITFTQLANRLGITRPALSRFVRDGLPYEMQGRRKMFAERAVSAWLVEHGLADPGRSDAGAVAVTRAECAQHFGVSQRAVGYWLNEPDFPGRSGSPGRRDGHFPLDEIATWLDRRAASCGGRCTASPELQAELLQVKVMRARRQLAEDAQRLAPITDVQAVIASIVARSCEILDSLPARCRAGLAELLDQTPCDRVVARIRHDVPETQGILRDTLAGDRDAEGMFA